MVLLVFSCAYQGSPSGGPKDIINPQLTNIFPPNESQLDSDSEIVIVFDENIKLNSFIILLLHLLTLSMLLRK